MLSRSLLLCLTTLALGVWPSAVRAADVYAQLFPLTGEIRLTNRQSLAQPITFYSITSASGALNGADGVWTSIDDTYDASASGLVDPVNEWFELSSTPFELTEGVFVGSGALPPTRAVSLGNVWNPFAVPFPDLAFDIRDAAAQSLHVVVELAIDGDYFADQVVDDLDYDFWRARFGSIGDLLADGNLDGHVDAADYVVWRQNYGLQVPLPPYLPGSGAASQTGAVPEPGAFLFAVLASASLACSRYWTRRSTSR